MGTLNPTHSLTNDNSNTHLKSIFPQQSGKPGPEYQTLLDIAASRDGGGGGGGGGGDNWKS